MNPYTDADTYKEWMPERYLAELSNDTQGYSSDDQVLQKALNWGAGLMESKLMVRDDIPIPAINEDDSVPDVIRECVHDLATYRLFDRRGFMNEQVEQKFNIQMTWLDQVSDNMANVKLLNSDGDSKTDTDREPKIDGTQEHKFNSDWTF